MRSSVTGPVYEVMFSKRKMVSPAAGLVPVPLFTPLKAESELKGLAWRPVPAGPLLLTNQTMPFDTPPTLIVTCALSVRFGVTEVFDKVYQKLSEPSNPAAGS